MPETLPTETIQHNGTTYEISFRWAVTCKHCNHTTSSASTADRISCGNCNKKNPRDQINGKYYTEYLKYTLFNGKEDTIKTITNTLQHKQDLYTAMQANGWELDTTTTSSHIALSKGDIPPQQLTA